MYVYVYVYMYMYMYMYVYMHFQYTTYAGPGLADLRCGLHADLRHSRVAFFLCVCVCFLFFKHCCFAFYVFFELMSSGTSWSRTYLGQAVL